MLLNNIILLLTSFGISISNAVRYDCFTAEEASEEQIDKYKDAGILETCTRDIEPCDPLQRRRLDGSCNNLLHPSIGTIYTKQYRLLPADDAPERKAKCGEKLPSPRSARLKILADGEASSPLVTQLFSYFLVGFTIDIITSHDTMNYLDETTYCCTPEGEENEICAPLKIEEDDFVHQFTGIRCMNLTKPLTFQHYGCTDNDTDPRRAIPATSTFDLSQIYNNDNKMVNHARTFTGGQLKYFKDDVGKIWAPNAETPESCISNDKETETRCNGPIGNGELGTTLISTWLWRMHIKIAEELEEMNPCWNDDKLFYTTRQILIAMFMQIAFYEFWPLAMGRTNMINAGIISPSPLFRDVYNPAVKPQISIEFLHSLRWFHTIQEGIVKMYDEDGVYLKQIPIVNLTLRFGYIARDNHISYITQGAIKQPGGEFDYIVDPYISQVGLGSLQRAADIPAFDLAKGRLDRLQGYIKYRDFCENRKHTSFEDIANVLNPGRLLMLKELYKDVEDIDLIAGLWSEKIIPGGLMPHTLYCILVEQLFRIVVSDRHWFERPNSPHAFNAIQLAEIRKMTMSRMLCDVGDSITNIQPFAFLQANPGNPVISCDLIPKVNLLPWKDPNC